MQGSKYQLANCNISTISFIPHLLSSFIHHNNIRRIDSGIMRRVRDSIKLVEAWPQLYVCYLAASASSVIGNSKKPMAEAVVREGT
jgi:hypothetical protein